MQGVFVQPIMPEFEFALTTGNVVLHTDHIQIIPLDKLKWGLENSALSLDVRSITDIETGIFGNDRPVTQEVSRT